MAITRSKSQSHATEQQSSEACSAPSRVARKTLITDDRWDSYDLASLLPLEEVFQENAEFGYVLRHYWIPVADLQFRQSSRKVLPNGSESWEELLIDRRMARCRSTECTWYETVRPVAETSVGGDSAALGTMLCTYNCYAQSYRCARPVPREQPASGNVIESRRCALYKLPMVVPPGPVKVGFAWHAKVADDYMNYRLEAERQIEETSVLVVRREGRYTMWLPGDPEDSGNGHEAVPVVTRRQGVTLFAWNRGVVLEDRFLDQVESGDAVASPVGATNQVVTRLIRSCPAE